MNDGLAVADATPNDQRISVSVERINYGDDKGKYRIYWSASRSETYDDMTSALKAMAQYGAPSVVTIGKSVSFYVIDKTRKVRTPEGARRYGLPIGSPITAEARARAKLGRGKPANSGLKARMDANRPPRRAERKTQAPTGRNARVVERNRRKVEALAPDELKRLRRIVNREGLLTDRGRQAARALAADDRKRNGPVFLSMEAMQRAKLTERKKG